MRRDYARLRAYNTLLEQIYHRIYATSQLSGNTSSVLYSVPPFILGLPKLDMEDCIVYLVWQLRANNFDVRFTWPNILYISWKHHESIYLAKQNPIVQAMVPEPISHPQSVRNLPGPASQRKKPAAAPAPPARPVVSFSQEIDVITNTAPSAAPFGLSALSAVAGPRRAADYEPPASFIQNLDRPGPGRMPKEGAKGNVLADLWTI